MGKGDKERKERAEEDKKQLKEEKDRQKKENEDAMKKIAKKVFDAYFKKLVVKAPKTKKRELVKANYKKRNSLNKQLISN